MAEADAAAGYYRDQRADLARRFLNSLDEASDRVALHPGIYREVEPGVHKCKLKTFPYALVFRDDEPEFALPRVHNFAGPAALQ